MAAEPEDTLQEALEAEAGLRSLARALLLDRHAAEDAVQHAWLRWLQHGRGAPLPFLKRAVRHEAIDRWRSARRRRARESAVQTPEPTPSPAEMVAGEQERRRLWAAVHGLDEPYRGTLWLRFYEDLPPRAVARRLGVPVETVRTRTRRGLDLLRERLGHQDHDWRRRLALAFGLPWVVSSSSAPLGVVAGTAAVTLLVLGSATAWLWDRGPAPGGDVPLEARRAAATPEDLPPAAPAHDVVAQRQQIAHRPAAAADPSGAGPATRSVEVVHADGHPAVDLPVWLWDTPRPRQAWLPERGSGLGRPMHGLVTPSRMPERVGTSGWTGDDGICVLLEGPGFGVTVGLDDSTWVSFEGVPDRVVLPPVADVGVDVSSDLEALYELRLYPARLEGPDDPEAVEYAATDVRPITTASGPAVLFLRRRLLIGLRSPGQVTLRLPVGQLYAPEVEAYPFRMRPKRAGLRAPDRLELEVLPDQPGLRVEVVEADGSASDVNGGVRLQPIGAPTDRGHGAADLEAGSALLPIRSPDVRNEVTLILDDGELFRRELEPLRGTVPTCRFVRGEGIGGPSFELPPEPAGLHFVGLVFECGGGGLEVLPEPKRIPMLPGGPLRSWSLADGRVTFRSPPAGWRRARLCAQDGTVLQIHPGVRRAVGEPLSEPALIDLEALHEARGRPSYARYMLEATFRGSDGADVGVPLRWLTTDPLTTGLPVWSWRRSSSVADLRLRVGGPGGWTTLPMPR